MYQLSHEFLGKNHPNSLLSLSNIACTYYFLGDLEKALQNCKRVLALSCEVLGETHPQTIDRMDNLAVVYEDLGEHRLARIIEKKTEKSDDKNELSSLDKR